MPTDITETRDDTCYFCTSPDNLERHHILPQRFDGSDHPDNIVTVCHECHWKLERLYNKDLWDAIGIEDPRATKESHVRCERHDCIQPATTRENGYYRCDDHSEIKQRNRELRSYDKYDSTESSDRHQSVLYYIFNHIITECPADESRIAAALPDEDTRYELPPGELTRLWIWWGEHRYWIEYSHSHWKVEYRGTMEET